MIRLLRNYLPVKHLLTNFTTLSAFQISLIFLKWSSMHFFMSQPKSLTSNTFLHPHLLFRDSLLYS